MKRILGIILAILSCVILFAFLVLGMVADGLSFGHAILVIVLSTIISFVIVGWVILIMWLLS